VEEIEELDTDVMLDSLQKLDWASEELLKVLTLAIPQPEMDPTALNEIATEGTKAYKLYQKRLSTFMLFKGDYISARQDYIRPQIVSRALFDVSSVDSIPHGAMRPDSVLYKANLAHMLHILLIHARNPAIADYEIKEALEGLDQVFPEVIAGTTFSQSQSVRNWQYTALPPLLKTRTSTPKVLLNTPSSPTARTTHQCIATTTTFTWTTLLKNRE
jgi:hypothetical protein